VAWLGVAQRGTKTIKKDQMAGSITCEMPSAGPNYLTSGLDVYARMGEENGPHLFKLFPDIANFLKMHGDPSDNLDDPREGLGNFWGGLWSTLEGFRRG
jgi:hypothetical protein